MPINRYIGIALGITSQDWRDTGLSNDPATAPSDDVDETATRITALLLIRIVAWIQPRGMFPDLSTTTICRSMLINNDLWPEQLDDEAINEIKEYVTTILVGYNDVPYHNFKHCYHVTISANKLVDMIVHVYPDEKPVHTYGFRDDPLMQFAMLFSALIHDVDHRGIPNRQLALEDEELAIKYNDQSIAENESLFIGFSKLLNKKYGKFRSIIFPERSDYRRFRMACVNMVRYLLFSLNGPTTADFICGYYLHPIVLNSYPLNLNLLIFSNTITITTEQTNEGFDHRYCISRADTIG